MYQVSKDRQLDAKLIEEAIEYSESNRQRLDMLNNYYLGEQEITRRVKQDTLKNNRLVVNHAKYITDLYVGYLLGNPVDYQVDDDKLDIQPLLDAYKRQTMENIDVEIAKDCSIFGRQYEYVYADESANPCSVVLDSRNTVVVYDDTMVHHKLYGIHYRPMFKNPRDKKPNYYEVIAMTDREIIKYTLKNGQATEQSREQHSFGAVPLVEYKNNAELKGDFEPVISLIDAYNLVQSDRVNDREQLVDAILCFYGMAFDADQMADLKEKRALANIPPDGKVEYLTKTINEGDVDVLRQTIEQDIHKISMVPNISDQNFVGNSSGVAIRYKLLAFEQAVKNKERFFEKALMERFALYTHFLAVKSTMQEVKKEDVDAVFTRNLPSNDYETSQMITNLDGIVDRELLASQLSFVKDASKTVEAAKQESDKPLKDAEYATNDYPDHNALDSASNSLNE